MVLEASEIRRIKTEGYAILTDSDVEDLYDNDVVLLEPAKRRVTAISVFGGPIQNERGDPFPQRWEHWCHHCCHLFKTAPFGIPTEYDERRDRYFCIGRYCSDSCAKAVMAERGWTLGPIGSNFMNMIRKAYGQGWDYRSGTAPPRTRLVQFGGDLTIEQFRAYADQFMCYHVPPNVIIEMEQMAEVGRRHQDQRRERRKKTIKRAQEVAVTPHKPPPPRRRPVTMTRATPLPKKTYTLDTFWHG